MRWKMSTALSCPVTVRTLLKCAWTQKDNGQLLSRFRWRSLPQNERRGAKNRLGSRYSSYPTPIVTSIVSPRKNFCSCYFCACQLHSSSVLAKAPVPQFTSPLQRNTFRRRNAPCICPITYEFKSHKICRSHLIDLYLPNKTSITKTLLTFAKCENNFT